RGHLHFPSCGRHERRADQDRRSRPRQAHSQVQPVAQNRRAAGVGGPLRRLGAVSEAALKRLRRPWVRVATLLILLLGLAFLTQVVPYRQIIEANQNVADARARLAALEEENSELGADVEALE